jgi:hypothetical protein
MGTPLLPSELDEEISCVFNKVSTCSAHRRQLVSC